jgi:hypothetical protein
VADKGYVRAILGPLEADQRQVLGSLFDYLLKNWRVGLPGHQKAADNMAWVQLNGTTASVANQEVAIAHGLSAAPRVLFPVLDLTTTGKALVPLTVTRAADASYVYLASSSTSAAFTVFVETRA